LDNPVWAALVGPHASLGEGSDRARRYREEFAPFGALRDAADPQDWEELAALVGPGGVVAVAGSESTSVACFRLQATLDGLQMVATDAFVARPDVEAMVLGAADVDDMRDLVRQTEPGPFRSNTWEMGRYLGIRVEGRLVAMAGERLHLARWTEISAVCTDPDYRGRGLAARLVRAVGEGIRLRGERVLLHVSADNVGAVRLYERLGFVVRRPMRFLILQAAG
jgi:ribosomal protein S18 acetylase RimI-like enzyme